MRRAFVIGVIAWFAACAAASAGVGRSGIDGRIVVGPTCPVEHVPPEPQCAPRPLAATLRINPAGRRSPSWTVRSGADGRFSVRLPAGRYIVTALPRSGSPFPRPPGSFETGVHPGRFTYITITYDSGIR
jgi:hypothetical protein